MAAIVIPHPSSHAAARRPRAVTKISDLLSPVNVMIDLRIPDKAQLLQELAVIAARVLILPPDEISFALLKREELGSTGMGGGVAVPHARIEKVNRPFGTLIRLNQPIHFAAVDGRPVDLVFPLLLSTTPEVSNFASLPLSLGS